MNNKERTFVFSGSGGGDDEAKTYVEQADTLASKQYLRVMDLISEGEIEGLVAGSQSVFYDDTPVQNKDGSYNIKGVKITGKYGTQTQTSIPGFSFVESAKQVGVRVKKDTPIARAIESPDATSVRVSVSIPSLRYTDPNSNSTGSAAASVSIELQSNNGPWVPMVYHRDDVSTSEITQYLSQTSNTLLTGIRALVHPELCVKYTNLANTDRQYVAYTIQKSVHGLNIWSDVVSGEIDMKAPMGSGSYPGGVYYFPVVGETNKFHGFEASGTVIYDYKLIITKQINSGTLAFDIKKCKGKVEWPFYAIYGKTSDTYVKDFTIKLSGGAPYNVRVKRITNDSTSQLLENDTYFNSYTEIINHKYRYPNSAYILSSIDSSQYSSVPTRSFEIKGIRCKVPNTYDAIAKTYSGIWDGVSFVVAWTDNPVWILYDLLTNTRYGLGDKISPSQIDVAKFYEISQYCDELVDNGFKGKEPRYTCSLYIQGKTKAMQLLADVASVFQGYLYWAGGKLTANYDHPSDPLWLFNNSNVIDGQFTYEGTDKATRYTVALVSYTDRSDNYAQKVEYVEDRDGIVRWGQNTIETTAIGCMSRGQAHRLGKNILLSNRYLTETVSFKAGIESNAASLLPGDVIQVSDSLRAGIRRGGRVLSASTSQVEIDSDVTIEEGKTYTLNVISVAGEVLSSEVNNISGDTNLLEVSLPSAPQEMSVWVLESNDIQAQLFRIVSIKEEEPTIYSITAVAYNPSKYAAIENDVSFIPLDISGEGASTIAAPEIVSLTEELFFDASKNLLSRLEISLKQHTNPYFHHFKGMWRNLTEGGRWKTIPDFTENNTDIEPITEGDIEVAFQAVNSIGISSSVVYQTITVKGKTTLPSDVTGFGVTVNKGAAYLRWDAFTLNSDLDVSYFVVKHSSNVSPSWVNGVIIADKIPAPATSFVVPALPGAYMIKAVDSSGNYSANAALIQNNVSNIEHYNVVEVVAEQPTWSGDKLNVYEDNGRLILAATTTLSEWNPLSIADPLAFGGVGSVEGEYTTGIVDLGEIYSSRLSFLIDTFGYNKTNIMSGWPSLNAISSLAGGESAQYSVDVLYRASDDGVFGEWSNTLSGEVKGRYFQFKLKLKGGSTNITPVVEKFEVTIDMQDRVDGAENVVATVEGKTVTYSPSFHNNPAVAIIAQGMATGDYYSVSSKSPSGFSIQFFNSSGTPVNRTFDWVAKGYGFKY